MKWQSEKQRKRNNGNIDQVGLSPHVSIITLNVNRLNSPINRHRVVGWIRKEDPTICCRQETHISSKNKQAQNEWMGDNTPRKWQIKESRCCQTYIRQSRLQDKKDYERQRGAVYNDKGDFPLRGHNTYKDVCT